MTVGIAVLGAGRIGAIHARHLAGGGSGAVLRAVHDVRPEAASALAGELDVPAVVDLDRLLALPGLDAVAVCTTTETHVDLIEAAAAAGKDVFCEKPLALDLASVDRAVDAVERGGVRLHVGFNRRFDPGHRAVADDVAAGRVGRPELVRITSRDPGLPPTGYLAGSGGIFLDMTVHDFDMARFVTGSEVMRVHATGAVRVDPAVADLGDLDTAVVVLGHADGTITTIDNSRRAVYGYDQRIEVLGSEGLAVSANPRPVDAERWDGHGAHLGPIHRSFEERYARSYAAQWTAFARSVRDGAPPAVTGRDARAALTLGLAAWRSVREGRPIHCDELPAEGGAAAAGDATGAERGRVGPSPVADPVATAVAGHLRSPSDPRP